MSKTSPNLAHHILYYTVFGVALAFSGFMSVTWATHRGSIYQQGAALFLIMTVFFMVFEYIAVHYWKSAINPHLEYPVMANRVTSSIQYLMPEMDMSINTKRLAGPSSQESSAISGLKASHRVDWIVSMDRMADRIELLQHNPGETFGPPALRIHKTSRSGAGHPQEP
jgi:hypothetical protein